MPLAGAAQARKVPANRLFRTRMVRTMRLLLSSALCALLFSAAPGLAQDTTTGLRLELNRVDPLDGACRLTFLAENSLGSDLEALTVETVLIDTLGRVERLTLFAFGTLPDGVPRVRQFDIPGLDCESLGRVLINGITECSQGTACAENLDLSSRTEVEVIG